jgi:hypothetical protein
VLAFLQTRLDRARTKPVTVVQVREVSVELVRTVAGDWLSVVSVRVGHLAPGLGTPDRYVLVSAGDQKVLRVDVYGARSRETFAFEEAQPWAGFVAIGFGHRFHLVPIDGGGAKTTDLGSYFGSLYPTDGYMLVASAERVFRFERDGRLAWASVQVGLDGVIVHDPTPPVIRGSGEWDPPGGWCPFEIAADSGLVASRRC